MKKTTPLLALVLGLVTIVFSVRAAALQVVEVSAPDIHCIYDLDCSIFGNDFSDDFSLPGTAGEAFLQSSLYAVGEPGTPAAGLYGYQYRLNMQPMVDDLGEYCVTEISLPFGPIIPLDYDGDGQKEDGYVVTGGAVGNILPAVVDQTGDELTFRFDPGVCNQGATSGGDSSYFIGLTSAHEPRFVSAQLQEDLTGSFDLQTRAPQFAPEDDDDGVPAAVEDGAPNNGDGNDDGIPDSEQENVTSFPNNTDGSYVTLEEINGAQLNDVQAITNPSPADAPDVDFPIGFLDFRIAGVGPGGTAVLKVFLGNDVPIDTYYKYGPTLDNPTPHWYEFLYDGTTGVKFEDDKILLHFKDGQRGDDDLDNNGVITDAGTLANCIKVTQIEILPQGNLSVQTGQILDLEVKFLKQQPMDPDPSNPKKFQWSTNGLIGGQGTRKAQYRWATSTPPTHTVSVTVSNCEGTLDPGMVTATKTITVTSGCIKVTGVEIKTPAGAMPPSAGVTGQMITFKANPIPPGATNPAYVWSWSRITGTGTPTITEQGNEATYTWPAGTTGDVVVDASNCAGQSPPGSAQGKHRITITEGCTEVKTVEIKAPSGGVPPSTGITGQPVTFEAIVTSGATNPTFQWSFHWSQTQPPVIVQTNPANFTWDAAGAWNVNVSATSCGVKVDAPTHQIAISPPTVQVINEAGQAVVGAAVYRNGTLLDGRTGADGKLVIPTLQKFDKLVATQQRFEQPLSRAGHDGWGYRVYITSLDIPRIGEPTPAEVTNLANIPPLTVKNANTLIGFNFVVSLEWDASAAYLEELRQGFAAASQLLYDASDGQMLFESVALYDNAQHFGWQNEADYILFARNRMLFTHLDGNWLPYSLFPFKSQGYGKNLTLARGRPFDDVASSHTPWTEPIVYRSIIHEFASYGIGLNNSYGYFKDGEFSGPTYCTSPAITDPATNADVNASLMAYAPNATEFSRRDVPGLWSDMCELTTQFQTYGKSDWEVIQQVFSDIQSPARWTIKTPKEHGGVVAGPHAIPVAGWSTARIGNDANTGTCATAPRVQAKDSAGRIVPKAWVVLPTQTALSNFYLIEQGETDANGIITVLGAKNGDEVFLYRAWDPDWQLELIGRVIIDCPSIRSAAADSVIEVVLEPAAFILNVSTTPGSTADEIVVTVTPSATLNAPPLVNLYQIGASAPLTLAMQFDSASGSYNGRATLNSDLGLSGTIIANASDVAANYVHRFTTFDITPVSEDEAVNVRSTDSRAQLYLPAGTLSADGWITIELVQQPGPLPDGLVALSGPYTIKADSDVTLIGPANLILSYLDVGGTLRELDLSTAHIYRWNGSHWTALDGTSLPGSVSALIDDFGTYALLAEAAYPIFLPVSIR